MLEIKNLHVRIAEDETEIIKGLNLSVAAGEVAAIMAPNAQTGPSIFMAFPSDAPPIYQQKNDGPKTDDLPPKI